MEAVALFPEYGYVTFTEKDKLIEINVNVKGFKEGLHGFHVHESGDLRNGCDSLCAHFNPYNATHGGPGDSRKKRHVGDLGNIKVNKNGVCKMKFTDNMIKLSGKYSIIGRSVIIHEGEDDLGKGEDEESLKTGNAGKRITCGVIGLAKTEKLIESGEEKMDPEIFFASAKTDDMMDHVPVIEPIDKIIFNSKSANFYELSNFYGGVEPCYMKDRFENKKIKDLFDDFDSSDKEKFLYYLKKLQPEKSWTDAKLNYWFKAGKPITGILSKLAGGSVKNTAGARRRLKVLVELSGLEEEVKIRENRTNDEKIELMMKCLREKYNKPYYRTLLLSTGDSVLHEKPMRGKGDFWTFPGEDTLGKLLMKVREEIK